MPEKIINGVDVEGLNQILSNLKQQPELGSSHFRVHNHWIHGAQNQSIIQGFYAAGQEDTSRTVPFLLTADEPPILFGENKGANPVEFLLHALASCMTTSMVYHAAARGIQIEELETQVEGDIDLRGFMGLDPNVKKGFSNISITFSVKSDATPEKLKELASFSPVFNTLVSGVPVNVKVNKPELAHA